MIYSLSKCKYVELFDIFVFIDGPKNKKDMMQINLVTNIFRHTCPVFIKKIVSASTNRGIHQSVRQGLDMLFQKYDSVITLEDDLIVNKQFLEYMITMLHRYIANKKIFSISGYCFPKEILKIKKDYKYGIYFFHRPCSWGWATWKDRWNKAIWRTNKNIDVFINSECRNEFKKQGDDVINMLKDAMHGKVDSWAILWSYTHYKHNALAVYPVKTLIKNIGVDGSGTHGGTYRTLQGSFDSNEINLACPKEVRTFQYLDRNIRTIFKQGFKKKIRRIVRNAFFKIGILEIFRRVRFRASCFLRASIKKIGGPFGS